MPPTNTINQDIHAALVQVANLVVASMKNKLSSGYPSGDKQGLSPIQDTISVGQVQQEMNGLSIMITLGGKDAPYARAYEWGSGIHATRGTPHLIPIAAKNAPNLVFWWEKGNKLFVGPKLPIGHPGVAPKPYIEPSIRENKAQMKKIMGREFKAAILSGTERVTEITVGI